MATAKPTTPTPTPEVAAPTNPAETEAEPVALLAEADPAAAEGTEVADDADPEAGQDQAEEVAGGEAAPDARVVDHDNQARTCTVEVTGFGDQPLRFNMPAPASTVHLDSLVGVVAGLWARPEDRRQLLDQHRT